MSISGSPDYMHIGRNYDKITWMKKPQKTFVKILQGLLIFTTLVAMIVLGMFLWNLVSTQPIDDDPVIVDPSVKQTFEFSINKFTMFEIEEFGFDFVLAEIHIESNKSINLSLSHFVTSEDVQLNNVENYLNIIESAGYTFGDNQLVFSLSTPETTLDALIFIPIINTDLTTLDLNINIYPNSVLTFDLQNPTLVGTKSDLGVSEQGIDPNMVADMVVTNKTEVNQEEFYQLDSNGNRVEANFTSQSQIVAIKVKITSKISEPFRITKAYIKDGSTLYNAVDKTFLIDGVTNLNDAYINESTEGYLFFEILGDATLESFIELQIYLSTTEENYFTLPLTGN